MERTIVGLHEDAEGEWVAELDCGHDQHVRHRPPFEVRPWVLSEQSRAERIGSGRDCPLCDRSLLPARVEPSGTTQVWDEDSLPDGVRRAHRLPEGRWALLKVTAGELRFSSADGERTIAAGDSHAIPPGVVHDVEPLGRVRFELRLYKVTPSRDADRVRAASSTREGGEAPCFADLVCPQCGAVAPEHRPGCPRGTDARE